MSTCSIDTSHSALQRSASAIPFDRSPPGQKQFPIDFTSLRLLDLGAAAPMKSRKVTVMTPKPGMSWDATAGAILKDGTQTSPQLKQQTGSLRDLVTTLADRRRNVAVDKVRQELDQTYPHLTAIDGCEKRRISEQQARPDPTIFHVEMGHKDLDAGLAEWAKSRGFDVKAPSDSANASQSSSSAAAAKAGDECNSGEG